MSGQLFEIFFFLGGGGRICFCVVTGEGHSHPRGPGRHWPGTGGGPSGSCRDLAIYNWQDGFLLVGSPLGNVKPFIWPLSGRVPKCLWTFSRRSTPSLWSFCLRIKRHSLRPSNGFIYIAPKYHFSNSSFQRHFGRKWKFEPNWLQINKKPFIKTRNKCLWGGGDENK